MSQLSSATTKTPTTPRTISDPKLGTVAWFGKRNDEDCSVKSYGFIAADDGGEDVYVHFTAIDSQSKFRKLKKGQRVEFEDAHNERGRYAKIVRVVNQ